MNSKDLHQRNSKLFLQEFLDTIRRCYFRFPTQECLSFGNIRFHKSHLAQAIGKMHGRSADKAGNFINAVLVTSGNIDCFSSPPEMIAMLA